MEKEKKLSEVVKNELEALFAAKDSEIAAKNRSISELEAELKKYLDYERQLQTKEKKIKKLMTGLKAVTEGKKHFRAEARKYAQELSDKEKTIKDISARLSAVEELKSLAEINFDAEIEDVAKKVHAKYAADKEKFGRVYEKAIVKCKDAHMEDDPFWKWAWLSEALDLVGETKEATEYLEKSFVRGAMDNFGNTKKSTFYDDSEPILCGIVRAENIFRKWEAESDKNKTVPWNKRVLAEMALVLGSFYEDRGDFDKASAYYTKIKGWDPQQAEILNTNKFIESCVKAKLLEKVGEKPKTAPSSLGAYAADLSNLTSDLRKKHLDAKKKKRRGEILWDIIGGAAITALTVGGGVAGASLVGRLGDLGKVYGSLAGGGCGLTFGGHLADSEEVAVVGEVALTALNLITGAYLGGANIYNPGNLGWPYNAIVGGATGLLTILPLYKLHKKFW